MVEYAPTRIFRQPGRPRTPARAHPIVVLDPSARGGPLPHPRLVRRARPLASGTMPPVTRNREFEDEPTDPRRARD